MDSGLIRTLKQTDCWHSVDRVPHDPEMTEFKRRTRLHQARWRQRNGYTPGGQLQRDGLTRRAVGTRLDLVEAKASGCNFLCDRIRDSVEDRLANPQRHQTLNPERLWSDLLSSMPMCFNLFGEFHGRPDDASKALEAWLPDLNGTVGRLWFEWSPGRLDPGYLANRSAFDAAFVLDLPERSKGFVGIETKYHEHAEAEKPPSHERMARYEEVTECSRAFTPSWKDLIGTELQQIWLDHLLLLSMLQNERGNWSWGRFVLVYPAKNVSIARAADGYRALLTDQTTFITRTLEETLEAGVPPSEINASFRERYLW